MTLIRTGYTSLNNYSIRNLVMKTVLSGFRPTVPAASSSRTAQMMKISLSSCHKETLILHLVHQQHCHLLTLLYCARYRCTTASTSFAILTVLMSTARDGFSHPRPPPKSKGSFQSFPLYLNITHQLCMMVVTFINQCNPNKNINFQSLYAVSHISKSFPPQFSLLYFQKMLLK